MSGPVVITGVGAVGAFGVGAEALGAAWRDGSVPTSEVDRTAGFHRPGGSRRALLARGLDLGAWLTPARARRMSQPARFAVAATQLALADAGLADRSQVDHGETAVVVGTAFGPAWITEEMLRQILGSGPEAASPAAFTESVASAAASQVALAIGARGPNLALTAREASDLLAVIDGARLVATGAARRALVIVVDEMTPLLHAVLDRFRALARPTAEGAEVARPFDLRRDGALAAEGASVLTLERADAAEDRGIEALAEIVATARGFDPTAPQWNWGEGEEPLASALRSALERSRVEPGAIDLVISGAGGTRRGDALEGRVLRRLFGEALPPIVAPKGALGGWGGGFAAAAALAAAGRTCGGTVGFAIEDRACGVRPSTTPPAKPRLTLVSSLGSGGATAWVALAAGQPDRRVGV